MGAASLRAPCGALAALATAALMLAPPVAADPIETIEAPTKVPKFEFTAAQGDLAPGGTGTYAFAMRNRYNASMLNVSVTAEVYRFATVEPARVVDLSDPTDGSRFLPSEPFGPAPVFARTGNLRAAVGVPALAPNGTLSLSEAVATSPNTPAGVYFTRHRVEFDYGNFTVAGDPQPRFAHFVMLSRGFLTDAEWATLNYTDLEGSLAALNISGIVPDSSFSVRVPPPLWPLGLLVGATGAAGTLAVAEFLVATNAAKHRRLERALLQLTGKWHVVRVTVEEELRALLGRRAAGRRGP